MNKKDFELLAETLAYTFVYNDNDKSEVADMLASVINNYEHKYPNFNRSKFIKYLFKWYKEECDRYDKLMATNREKTIAVRIPLGLLS